MHVTHQAAIAPAVGVHRHASARTDSRDDSIQLLLSNALAALPTDRYSTRLYVARAWAMLQHDDAESNRGLRRLTRQQIERLQDYIDTHLDRLIRTSELAAAMHLNAGHFTQACKNTFGMTPLAYVSSRRIESACRRMLTTDASLTTIAVGHGFCDQSHFIRTFRRHIGITPQAWRRLRETAQRDARAAGAAGAATLSSR